MASESSEHAASTESVSGSVIRVFGTVGVDGPDGPVSIGGPRQRRLLGLLAIRVGTVVDIDWLAEYLWHDEDRPDNTNRAIRTYVSRLRQALPAAAQSWIETVPSGYRLLAPPEAVEHLRVASLRTAATHARDIEDPQRSLTLLGEALELWRGEPFRELDDLDWARAEIEQLRIERLEMLEERWEAALALGRHTQITGELAAFTAEHQHRDRAARQYALALHRSGRTAEALRAIADFRRRLADESGLDPSPGMLKLQEDLLADDPSLRVERVGRPLRGYRLLEEAGSGAFSVVWRGEQPSVQREVAIKQIRAELASQPEFIRRFEAEAHLVARLEHPHIVPLIDFWRDPDSAYLVMRWLPGGTLERRLDDGPLTLDETRALAHQIGGALSAAHARGIVHRDVKTANILFDDDGNAFLGDFGIALEATASDGPEAALSPGSPLYASPEQLRREPLGPEADVFSFGIVLYECLTGTLPFPVSTSAEDRLAARIETTVSTLSRQNEAVPPLVTEALAIATAHDPGDRFDSVTALLDALDVSGAPTTSKPRPAVASDVSNPYVGLRAFDDGDTDRFFGRDRLVTTIIGRLAGVGTPSRCVTVVGPSGSGKSSVVRAGVIPALRRNAVPGAADWFVTTMVPGEDPFESLEAALLRIAVNPPPTLLDQLRDGPRGILRGVRRCLGSDDDHLLLVADQFEELFASAAGVVDDFLHGLAVAIEDPSSPLRFVATLRADFYDRPLSHTAFAPLLAAGAVDVLPLAADELERAITEPAALVGVRFEPGLVARIAAEAVTQPAPLPLLQYTLSELFDHRSATEPTLTNESYDELGGVAGAVAARAEALYDASNATEQDATRRVFGRLADPTPDSIDLRRRVPVADFADDPAARSVVEQFAAARLVTLDRDAATREPTVEVAHEALFRGWPRLATWLDEDREVLRATNVIAAAATEWDTGGRSDTDLYRGERLAGAVDLDASARRRLRPIDNDFVAASERASEERGRTERTRIRRLRRLVAGTAAALVIALIAGGIAISQQRRADDEAQAALAAAAEAESQALEAEEARAEADIATLISRSAAQSAEDPQLSILLALEAYRRSPGAETEQAVLGALTEGRIGRLVASYPRVLTSATRCGTSLVTSDGLMEYSVVDGSLLSQDLTTGAVVDHGSAPEPCGAWLADPDQNLRYMFSNATTVRHLGPLDGDWEVELDPGGPTDILGRNFGENRLIFISGTPESATLRLRDATTGEPVGSAVSDVVVPDFPVAALSPDLAVITAAIDSSEASGGLVVVLDARTGDEMLRLDVPRTPQAVAIDADAEELLVAMEGGTIATVDLETGDLVGQVTSTATAPFDTIGVRPDGTVVVSSAGQVDVFDRRIGPTGDSLALRGTEGARIRPDGTVLVVQSDRYDIYDFDSSGLVEKSWSYDPNSLVNIESGVAGIVDPTDGAISLVDLASGERNEIELVDPTGARLVPDGVVPIPDGLLAFTFAGEVSRWVDGRLTEVITVVDEPGSVSDGGAGFDDRDGAAYVLREDRSQEVVLVSTRPGELGTTLRVEVEGGLGTAYPSNDGGLHVMSDEGTLRTYDSSGQISAELETGHEDLYASTSDESAGGPGRLVFGGRFTTIVVDPVTEEIIELTDAGEVISVGFARGGELVVLAATDGSVQLWDLGRTELLGVLWDGSGSRHQNTPWYDSTSDSVWVASSGELLQLPVDPSQWVERACEIVGRDFTQDEWDRFVPGDGEAQSACTDVDT